MLFSEVNQVMPLPEQGYKNSIGRNQIHSVGHTANANLKDMTNGKVHLDWMYGKKRWSAEQDRKRAEHHQKEAERKIQEQKQKQQK